MNNEETRPYPSILLQCNLLDVRAFGCLIDDMLQHRSVSDDATIQKKTGGLEKLRDRCMEEKNWLRPRFAEIVSILTSYENE